MLSIGHGHFPQKIVLRKKESLYGIWFPLNFVKDLCIVQGGSCSNLPNSLPIAPPTNLCFIDPCLAVPFRLTVRIAACSHMQGNNQRETD